jgi:hypothetical protein
MGGGSALAWLVTPPGQIIEIFRPIPKLSPSERPQSGRRAKGYEFLPGNIRFNNLSN